MYCVSLFEDQSDQNTWLKWSIMHHSNDKLAISGWRTNLSQTYCVYILPCSHSTPGHCHLGTGYRHNPSRTKPFALQTSHIFILNIFLATWCEVKMNSYAGSIPDVYNISIDTWILFDTRYWTLLLWTCPKVVFIRIFLFSVQLSELCWFLRCNFTELITLP